MWALEQQQQQKQRAKRQNDYFQISTQLISDYENDADLNKHM